MPLDNCFPAFSSFGLFSSCKNLKPSATYDDDTERRKRYFSQAGILYEAFSGAGRENAIKQWLAVCKFYEESNFSANRQLNKLFKKLVVVDNFVKLPDFVGGSDSSSSDTSETIPLMKSNDSGSNQDRIGQAS